MQLIRPTVWGPGLVTSLKDAGSTQPLNRFWSQQSFEQFLAAAEFWTSLWLAGLCWLQPPHVTSSSSCSKVFVPPAICWFYSPPLLLPSVPPLLGTRFLLQQQQLQKGVEKDPFSGSSLFSEARGDVSPPPAASRLVGRGAARSCFSRRLLPASSRAAPSVHQPADLAGLAGRRPNAKSVLLSKVYFCPKCVLKSVFLDVYTSASGSKWRRRPNVKSNCCRYLM